ncbi:ABC transporter ATP-binding protein [Lactobacillus equicursoris]|uniref:ABC transporter ATP-binding protein n=1 Tax=Lactobacillus equicursoris TaxID=420645 RepID=UPI003B847385
MLDILDEEPVVSENESGEEPTFSQADLQKVTFTYPDGDQPVLKDFSLHIPKGKIIGIHAPSGSGKSTILKLLARFYDASEGQVSISNTDIKKIKTSALRQLESYVPQDTWLASETIEANIKLGQAATRAEVIQAAKKASLHDFILTLTEGYDTKLGEGQQLSAGQKQRLGIARAFLHDGDLFLLDEITANLDALNEGIILKALKEESQDKTIVIVSHRLSTLAIADQIITL